jgi:hypothetical protein
VGRLPEQRYIFWQIGRVWANLQSKFWRPKHEEKENSHRPVSMCISGMTFRSSSFSEKIYNVRAGCIPIYHGHPKLRTGILRGLIYVDPEDYKFEPNATFDAALSVNIQEILKDVSPFSFVIPSFNRLALFV